MVDPGYEGAIGALMEVKDLKSIVLYRNSKLAQIVFEEMGGNDPGIWWHLPVLN